MKSKRHRLQSLSDVERIPLVAQHGNISGHPDARGAGLVAEPTQEEFAGRKSAGQTPLCPHSCRYARRKAALENAAKQHPYKKSVG